MYELLHVWMIWTCKSDDRMMKPAWHRCVLRNIDECRDCHFCPSIIEFSLKLNVGYSHMAHVESFPMVVFICRSAAGGGIERRRVYHAYAFDMELVLYECYDFEEPGAYVVSLRYRDSERFPP